MQARHAEACDFGYRLAHHKKSMTLPVMGVSSNKPLTSIASALMVKSRRMRSSSKTHAWIGVYLKSGMADT